MVDTSLDHVMYKWVIICFIYIKWSTLVRNFISGLGFLMLKDHSKAAPYSFWMVTAETFLSRAISRKSGETAQLFKVLLLFLDMLQTQRHADFGSWRHFCTIVFLPGRSSQSSLQPLQWRTVQNASQSRNSLGCFIKGARLYLLGNHLVEPYTYFSKIA
jgi:hypothetical protein